MASNQKRLQALDVMRGIAVAAMILFNNPGSWSKVYAPLKHADWIGLTPTDLAYPFFMFIMGVAVAFAMRRFAGDEIKGLWKILRRTLLIFVVGLFLSNFSKMLNGALTWENIRIMGVLQRLALVYGIGSIIYLFVPQKAHLPISALLLVAYVAILQCFNGYVCSPDNVLAKVDTAVLGAGHLITQKGPDGVFPFEPQSLLGTIAGVAHVLFGAFVGRLILENKDDRERVHKVAVFGTVLLFIGFLLQYLDPICKKIWTSSYTLVTCGAASLLLALLIDVIDVRGHEKWSGFFKVFGTNAMFTYVLASVGASLIGKFGIKGFLYGKVLQPVFGDYGGSLAYGVVFILFIFLLTLPLYKKKIFIKL